jgi:hypothetical protein
MQSDYSIIRSAYKSNSACTVLSAGLLLSRVTMSHAERATMPSRFESEPSAAEIEGVSRRIEARPGGAITWALEFAQRDLSGLTAGDWYNLSLELAAWLLPFQESPGVEPLRSEEQVRRLQRRFATIVASLLRDGQVHLGQYDIVLTVNRAGATGLTLKSPSLDGPYMTRLMVALFDHRSVIRTCTAPAPRGERGARCGRWFLSTRRSQSYCSRRCQSRASTQAFRHAQSKVGARHRSGGRATRTRGRGER